MKVAPAMGRVWKAKFQKYGFLGSGSLSAVQGSPPGAKKEFLEKRIQRFLGASVTLRLRLTLEKLGFGVIPPKNRVLE